MTTQEPSLDVEFVQVLQDMIADLTGSPQPVVVKLFSRDPDEICQLGRPKWPMLWTGFRSITRSRWWTSKTESRTRRAGRRVVFNINPAAAAKAGFTTEQLTTIASAIVDGEPTTAPVIINDRPYTLRVRYPAADRSSLEAMNNTMIVNASGGTATLGSVSTAVELPGQTEILRDNLQQEKEVTARLEGVDLGTGVAAVQKAVNDLHLPPSIRVEYGGTYKEQQKSFHDLVIVLLLALVLIFLVLLFEFRSFSAPIAILSSAVLSTSGVFLRRPASRSAGMSSMINGRCSARPRAGLPLPVCCRPSAAVTRSSTNWTLPPCPALRRPPA